jgi:hypothetical protein
MNNTFSRFRQNAPGYTLSDDFEDRVFAKIKKKKTQQKATASVVLSIAVFAFIFIAQAIFSHKKPGKETFITRSEVGIETKEEIPVMEDVIFASSDRQTNYAIEQVAYYEDENTI